MSRQLNISSLFSALALVSLALFARAGAYGEMQGAPDAFVVQVHSPADLAR